MGVVTSQKKNLENSIVVVVNIAAKKRVVVEVMVVAGNLVLVSFNYGVTHKGRMGRMRES